MSFANQGAISGSLANSNSIFRGSTAGGAVAASALDIDKFKEEIKNSAEQDKENLKEQVEISQKADLDSLKRQYDDILDSYSNDEAKESMFTNSYNRYKKDLDDQFNTKKRGLSSYYFGQLQRNYNNALKDLSSSLRTQVNKIADVAQKAKGFGGFVKANAKDIDVAEIRDLQNQFVDNQNRVVDTYKSIYSDNLKTIENNYNDYMGDVLGQIAQHGRGMMMRGKKISAPRKVRICRLYPRLCVKVKLPRVNLKKAINLKMPKVKKEMKDLSYQLDRNFKKMIF